MWCGRVCAPAIDVLWRYKMQRFPFFSTAPRSFITLRKIAQRDTTCRHFATFDFLPQFFFSISWVLPSLFSVSPTAQSTLTLGPAMSTCGTFFAFLVEFEHEQSWCNTKAYAIHLFSPENKFAVIFHSPLFALARAFNEVERSLWTK